MAELSTYPAVTTLAADDLIPVVTDPGVPGGNAVITAANLAAALAAEAAFTSLYAPVGSGGAVRVFASGRYYLADFPAGADAAPGDGKNYLTLLPFPVGVVTAFDRIGVYIATGQANTNIRAALYGSLNGQPSNLVVESGSLDSTVSTTAQFATINVTLQPGMYWLGSAWQGTGAVAPTFTSHTSTGPRRNGYASGLALANVANAGNLERYRAATGITGACPATLGAALSPTGGNSGAISGAYLRAT